jgi:hypothetical protein
MKGIKKIVIKQIITEDGAVTSFSKQGYNDFEVMGLLSYYNDAFKVECMQKASKNSSTENESSKHIK